MKDNTQNLEAKLTDLSELVADAIWTADIRISVPTIDRDDVAVYVRGLLEANKLDDVRSLMQRCDEKA